MTTYTVTTRESGELTIDAEHVSANGGAYEFYDGIGRDAVTVALVPAVNVLAVVRAVEQGVLPQVRTTSEGQRRITWSTRN